jgi:prophage DNA circulation protein
MYEPGSAGSALSGAVRQLVRNVADGPRDAIRMARGFYGFGSDLAAVLPITGNRRAQATNQAELLKLLRVTAAAEGARAAVDAEFESYQDAIGVRDEIVDALDTVMLAGADDATFAALRALRAAVVRDITARGANLARLVSWVPPATLPALVVAQQVYADGARAAELVQRNRIRHPLFVPGALPLEVLTDAR